MRFGLNVEDKKTLVKRIGELTGLQPRYTFMPRCAYEIGVYTVERRGDLVVEEADLDETIIQTLLSEGLILEGIREEDRMENVIEAATAEAAQLLIDTMRDEEKDIRLRKDCAVEVLNRVYGKPTQPIDGNMSADIGLSEEDRRLLRKVEKRLA